MSAPKTITRRHLLRGAGGLTLSLPILPSLLPRKAEAALAPRPRLVLFNGPQGGYWTHLNPPDAYATQQLQMHSGHKIRWADLRATPQGDGKVGLSRALRADPTVLDDKLLGRINLLRGVDHPNSRGHNKNSFGRTASDPHPGDNDVPSVDQLLAYSPTFYAPGEFRERCILTGGSSVNSGGAPGGVSPINDPQALFDRLFMKFDKPAATGAPAAAPAERPIVVDALYDSYRSLRESNRRLSTEDRRRLDNHMQHLADLQRDLSAPTTPRTTGCQLRDRPAKFDWPSGELDRYRSLAESKQLFKIYTDIIVAAFSCGMTRIAALGTSDNHDPFSDYTGGWHELAHAGDKDEGRPEAGLLLADSMQATFEHVLFDLARKLDAIEEVPGSTYLDNTLIFYTQDSSADAHNQVDRMVLTIGNVNGYFKTGKFVDYRNLERAEGNVDEAGQKNKIRFFTGVLVQQWWANVLHAFGIPKTEWQKWSKGTGSGYGTQRLLTTMGTLNKSLANAYLPAVLGSTGDKLPVIS